MFERCSAARGDARRHPRRGARVWRKQHAGVAQAGGLPAEALRIVSQELEGYSPELARRPRIIVATKCEDPAAEQRALELERNAGRPVRPISAVVGTGIPALLAEAYALVHATRVGMPGGG